MLNKTQLIGRLGKDPETRNTADGAPFTRFSLATDLHWTGKNGEKQSRAEWHNIVAWGKLAEICGEYLKKGRLVYVEGRLQTRQWEDDGGTKHQRTEIVIHDMKILEPKQPMTAPQPAENQPADEDVPF